MKESSCRVYCVLIVDACGLAGVLMTYKGTMLWKKIRKGWGKLSTHSKFQVGDGSKIKFCYDWGCEDRTLQETFLVVCSVAYATDASMAVYWEISSYFPQWNINFIRVLQDCEIDAFIAFFNQLYSINLRRICEDKFICAFQKGVLWIALSMMLSSLMIIIISLGIAFGGERSL